MLINNKLMSNEKLKTCYKNDKRKRKKSRQRCLRTCEEEEEDRTRPCNVFPAPLLSLGCCRPSLCLAAVLWVVKVRPEVVVVVVGS